MSWDLELIDDRGHVEFEQNYTHNTNRMMNVAAENAGHIMQDTWWKHIDGMEGVAGSRLLADIVAEMMRDPSAYRAMDPENGWGSYDTLLPILVKASTCVPPWPCVWRCSG